MTKNPEKQIKATTRVMNMKNGKGVLSMSKMDLINEYAVSYDVSKDEAFLAVEGTLRCIQSLLVRMSIRFDPDIVQLTLANFGRFDLKKVPAHEKYVNVMKTSVTVPEKRKLLFSRSLAWDAILQGKVD